MTTTRTVHAAAVEALEAGLCPIRARLDGTKAPLGEWKRYTGARPSRADVEDWFAGGHAGLGLVCGAVSGGLEMFEFEGRALDDGLGQRFLDAVDAAGIGELWDRVLHGYAERTPSGGMHVLWRCSVVEGNLKLARRPAGDGVLDVLIETRGEGGFTIVAPSNGTTHPSGRAWELIEGGFDQIATISAAERAAILAVARSFDEVPDETPPSRSAPLLGDDTGDRPGDEFNAANDVDDVLLAAGFHSARIDRNGDRHYTRPGKDPREGSSATVWGRDDRCTLFSSSIDAPAEYLDGHHRLDAWRLHAVLHHRGDFAAAASAWRASHPRSGPPAGEESFLAGIAAPASQDTEELPAELAGPKPINWSEFWRRDHTAEDWLVHPILPRGRQVALWARHKTGKSLLTLEVAAALATGRPCLTQGRCEPIEVIYLDFEMTEDDLHERLVDLGYGPDVDLSRLHYYLLPTLPPLDTPHGGVALLELVDRHNALALVIDTMARVTQGDENDADTYRAFYRLTGLHLKQRGVSLLRLDHGGKDPTRGQRGSSSKGDDVDIVWQLKPTDDGGLVLARDVSRISWVPERVVLQRLEDPLRHVVGGETYPTGTGEIAAELEALGLAVDDSQRTQIATYRKAGKKAKTEMLRHAIRFRREQANSDAARWLREMERGQE